MSSAPFGEGLEEQQATEAGPVGSRRERRRQETRDRLYQAAMQLLSEREFDAVTVEMITEAADVGKGTFFNYFANKEAVVGYRFEQEIALLAEAIHSITSPASTAPDVDALPMSPEQTTSPPDADSGGPVWRKMLEMTELVAKNDVHSRRLNRNLLALALVNEDVRRTSLHLQQQVCAMIEGVMEQGQRSGEFRQDISARDLAEFLNGMYHSALFQWAQSDSMDFKQSFQQMLHMAWETIRSRSEKTTHESSASETTDDTRS